MIKLLEKTSRKVLIWIWKQSLRSVNKKVPYEIPLDAFIYWVKNNVPLLNVNSANDENWGIFNLVSIAGRIAYQDNNTKLAIKLLRSSYELSELIDEEVLETIICKLNETEEQKSTI
jgi:hypothetical protein